MNLGQRLLAVAVSIAALVVILLAGIVVRQERILIAQIDEQVSLAASATTRAIATLEEAEGSQLVERPAVASNGNLYVGAVSPEGAVVVLAEPVSGPTISPDPEEARALARPHGVDDVSGFVPQTVSWVEGGGGVRTIVLDAGRDRTLIIAHSTGTVDDAQRQLIIASVVSMLAIIAALATAMWWIQRLGLRPIQRLTVAAEEVAAGRSDRRVEHASPDSETGRLAVAFNAMLDARQQAETRQRQFVADASHELRTPLTALRGYADLYFANGLETPEALDDAMRRIRTEGARMNALAEDLLTLAALDEGRPLDLGPVDLTQLLLDIGADASAMQPERAVDSAEVASGLTLHADRNLLTQAITAATSNTLRHTEVGAGLRLAARRVEGGHRSHIEVAISDEGPGIPADQLEHLFDRFYRGDTSRDTASGGRGLGLSIAKTIIEAHSGTIVAASKPGEGLSITMRIPQELS